MAAGSLSKGCRRPCPCSGGEGKGLPAAALDRHRNLPLAAVPAELLGMFHQLTRVTEEIGGRSAGLLHHGGFCWVETSICCMAAEISATA